ncbi:MAG: glycoside hydrolase family 2 TIM barrel-domain containing protein [Pseudomonadota bacterium]
MRNWAANILTVSLTAALLTSQALAQPVKTEIAERDGRYTFVRNGEPYFIKGAGIDTGDIAKLAARGGNSFRNWTTENAGPVLDMALEHGLTVALCLNIGRERQGFDYNDSEAVAAQLAKAREEVLKYKDHPALLAWIIGNEVNLEYKNPKVFDAVNDVSKMIHEVDPNHPTTTALAGFNQGLADAMNQRASDLDFISIQLYGDLVNLPKYLRQTKFQRPYVVSEWGAIGHWEMPSTFWKAPIEQNSSEKAGNYRMMHRKVIAYDSPLNMGSYVFLWGQKQERTSTWYGLFTETGESTEAVDVLEEAWTGKQPANRAPQLKSLRLNNRTAHNNPQLKVGQEYKAQVKAKDPDKDPLTYQWQVRYESNADQWGGDKEVIPPLVPGVVDGATGDRIMVKAPQRPGAYRLFVYAYDGQGNAAHANIPFLVRP